jgi:hypothetical protein
MSKIGTHIICHFVHKRGAQNRTHVWQYELGYTKSFGQKSQY